jgi:UTP:GlnB (protein PII) uridylyltransferase
MDRYSFLIVLAVIILTVVNDGIWRRWTEKLLNRLMAGNYKEYQYYEQKYAKDVKEVEKIRQDERVKAQAPSPAKTDQDAENLEEAWSEEEQEK